MDSLEFLKSFVAHVGSSGYPLAFKEEYQATWDVFAKKYPNPTSMQERFIQVITFMQYLENSGASVVEKPMKLPVRFTAKALYTHFMQLQIEDLQARSKEIIRKLQLNGLLVVKYKNVNVAVGDKIEITYALALAPKRKEPLDSVLFKLSSSLFPEVPDMLLEKYKRSGNSRTAAKSAHPKYKALFSNPSNVGRYPLYIGSQQTITLARSSEALLVLRFQYELPRSSVFWMSKYATTKLVEAIFKKVFVK